MQSGDQVKLDCSPDDSILKLKHKLYIEKDMSVASQTIIKMGQHLGDSILVKDLNLAEGQALQVVIQESQVAASNSLYDVIRKDD